MVSYFVLQMRMIARSFSALGIHPIIGITLSVFLFVCVSSMLFDQVAFAPYLYILFALSVILTLSKGDRIDFLKLCYGERFLLLRMFENAVCVLPFFAFLIYKSQFYFAGGLLITAIFLFRTRLNFSHSLNYKTPFFKRPFEFIQGFRSTFWMILSAYVLCAIAVLVDNFNLGIFSLLLIFLIVLTYYRECESTYDVWIYNLGSKQFLLKKMATAYLNASILVLPIIFIQFIFFFDKSLVVLLTYLLGLCYLTAMILAKYFAFPDRLNVTQGIILGVSVWFPPILILVLPFLFFKSRQKLNHILK